MKYLFAGTFLILILLSIVTYALLPDRQSDVPVIYWVTDANPARVEQVVGFHAWLVRNGFTMKGDPARPAVELKLDTANRQTAKQIIQGVSGVGGDVMDLSSPAGDHIFFDKIGLLYDMTDAAKELKNVKGEPIPFDPMQTFAAIRPEITVKKDDGKRHQVMFPCNVTNSMLWVNRDTFKKYGMAVPPKRMSFEQFESIGKEFVEKANKGKEFRDTFFANGVDIIVMFRSYGMSMYNETLTRCTLGDPRYVKCLKLIYKWTYKDRIIPSSADLKAASAAGGYGGLAPQLFNSGKVGMFYMGRYALIQLREFDKARKQAGQPPLSLAVVEHPCGGFPNALITTRGAAIYAGSKHKKYAELFLAYLASEDYNMQIVNDADALPPNPKYTKIEAFTKPKDYPGEWGCHEAFTETAEKIAVASSHSPFISPSTAKRLRVGFVSKYLSDLATAEQAAADTQRRINEEIDRRLGEEPALRRRHDKLLAIQKQIDERVAVWKEIDELQAAGKPVPNDLQAKAKKIPQKWITNVFYKKYYKSKGWAE